MKSLNPFKFGKEVGGYQFYDRQEDARFLRRKMVDGSSNVVLFAPRRYGKTSLVQKVLRELALSDGIQSLCFDLTKTPTVKMFCQDYANAVLAALKGHGDLSQAFMRYLAVWNPTMTIDLAGVVKFTFHADANLDLMTESITDVLDLPERVAHDLGDIPFVVAFDEFQEIAEISREFPLEKIFRSCIQRHRNVRYVFLGSKTHLMKRMFGDAARPFYNSACPMPLEKPPEAESLEFLLSRFRDAGLELADAEARTILLESQNVPYHLQELASGVFEQVTQGGRTSVTAADVQCAIDEIVARNAELYDVRIGTFSDTKYALACALASEPTAVFDEGYRRRHSLPVSSTIHAALRELVETGIVDEGRARKLYRLADPFFGRYLLQPSAKVFV